MTGKILADHSRKGKVLTPPLLNLGTFVDVSWTDLQVPEYIWINLLIKKYGVEKGTLLVMDIGKIVDMHFVSIQHPIAPMMISSYSQLSIEDKEAIREKLQIIKALDMIQTGLETFFKFYPLSPLAFLSKSKKSKIKKADLSGYKESLATFMDRTSFDATIVLAAICNFQLEMGRLQVTKTTNLPPLSKVLQYPNTEESLRLASFLRGTNKVMFGALYDRHNSWVHQFWNQNLLLEPPLI